MPLNRPEISRDPKSKDNKANESASEKEGDEVVRDTQNRAEKLPGIKDAKERLKVDESFSGVHSAFVEAFKNPENRQKAEKLIDKLQSQPFSYLPPLSEADKAENTALYETLKNPPKNIRDKMKRFLLGNLFS